MDKRMTAADVVAELRDGMTIGIAGWGARRKPMALVREILRSKLRDLTVVAYGGPDVGLLCAARKLRKVVFGFVSLDVTPLDNHFRRARQEGTIAASELDEGMLQWGLYAAALRLPFLPTRAGLATDVVRVNPELRTVRSPYADGETLLAMPAIPLDAALVHVNHCDARGNAQLLGPDPYFDEFFCGAAKRRYVSCERIVETAEFAKHGPIQTMLLNRTQVDGVIEAPFGAHPASCAPRYGIDAEHLKLYQEAARDDEAFATYRKRFLDGGEAAYLEAVGGAAHVSSIPQTIF
jgi:glutaconate CoA-transferase subunit A